MTEETDAKKVEALFNLQVTAQKSKLIDIAQGQFKFKWRLRDYLWGLWILLSCVGAAPLPNAPIYLKYYAFASIILFAAFQIHRISKLEHRTDAITKLLLKQ